MFVDETQKIITVAAIVFIELNSSVYKVI